MRLVLFIRLDWYDDFIWSRSPASLYSYPYLYLYFWINGADLLWTLFILHFYFKISIKLLTGIITNELQTGGLSFKARIFSNFCYSCMNWMYADLWDFFLFFFFFVRINEIRKHGETKGLNVCNSNYMS